MHADMQHQFTPWLYNAACIPCGALCWLVPHKPTQGWLSLFLIKHPRFCLMGASGCLQLHGTDQQNILSFLGVREKWTVQSTPRTMVAGVWEETHSRHHIHAGNAEKLTSEPSEPKLWTKGLETCGFFLF